MNSVQRAWRSVIRKPVKSILLLLVVAVITLFLLAGMASSGASIEMQDQTQQALGAGLQLTANEKNRTKRIEELTAQIGEDTEGSAGGYHSEKMETESGIQWLGWADNFFESLQQDDIEKIAGVSGIAGYNITTIATAGNPVDFRRIEDPDTDQSGDAGGITLIGNRDMSLHTDVLSGNITITEGRMITIDDQDVCIISKELAEENNLKVGDKMQFNDCSDTENSEVYEAEIVGIYEGSQKMTPLMSGDTYRTENAIFTDLRFPEKVEGNEGDPLYMYAYFEAEDVNKYEVIKKAVQELDIDWERYDLIDNNGNLTTMAANFNELEHMSNIFILLIATASFVMLFLIFTFWMKSRTKEAGILLSMGISKAGILGQILTEALLIAAAAFMLSFAAAPVVSQATADYFVNEQIQQEEEKKAADEGKIATEYKAPERDVTGVRVKIDARTAAIGTGASVVLITISVMAAGVSVIRKKPKSILSEMS